MTTFDNYHFTIDRAGFATAAAEGLYGAPQGALAIEEIAPTYDAFIAVLDRFGGPWGWNRRPRYADEDGVRARLAEPETRLFVFREADAVIGYCLVGGVKQSLKERFWESAHATRVVETENIALDHTLTGGGRGRYFLEHILRDLLARYDAVWLMSRSSNHEGVPRFYEAMGMTRAATERSLPEDLISHAELARLRRRGGSASPALTVT